MECNVSNFNFNLMDAFVKISLHTKEEILSLQGLLFRDFDNFGIICPKIHIPESEFKTITIFSPTCSREFEFSCSLSNIEDDFLTYISLEELVVNKKTITHRERTYTQDELATLRYCTKQNFLALDTQNDSYFGTYIDGISKQVMRGTSFEFINPLKEEYALDTKYMFVSISDANLYHGSPLVVEKTAQNNNRQLIKTQYISGILTTNPENASLTKIKKYNNLGILITYKSVQDFFKKF